MEETAEDKEHTRHREPYPIEVVKHGGDEADHDDDVTEVAAVEERPPAPRASLAFPVQIPVCFLFGRFLVRHKYWSCIAFSLFRWYLLLLLPISRAQKYYKK
jgi:hypothetical protein